MINRLLIALLPVVTVGAAVAQSFAVDNFPANASPDGEVLDVAFQNDGRLITVGRFTQVGPTNRSRIARFTLAGVHDTSLLVGSGANDTIHAVVVAPDNSIFIGGDFTEFDGHPVKHLVRLFPTGRIDLDFTANLNGTVRDLAISSNNLYAAGDFSGGLRRYNLRSGVVSSIIGSGANGPVHAVVVEELFGGAGDLVTIGGSFTRFSGVPVGNIAFLDREGRLDEEAAALGGADGPVYALAVTKRDTSPSTRSLIVAGGNFTRFNGERRADLATVFGDSERFSIGGRAELVPQSSLGASLDGTGEVLALAYEPELDLLVVGGDFSSFQTPWRNLFMAAPLGLIGNHPVNSYRPDDRVPAVAFQRDGMITIGGGFTQVNGMPRPRLARILGVAGSSMPATPAFLSNGALDTDKIHLAWEEVDHAVGYKLERRPVGGSWGPVTLEDPSRTEILLRNLPAGSAYFFRVSAFNGNGTSGPSDLAVNSTLSEPPLGLPDPSFDSGAGVVRATRVAIDRQQRMVCFRHNQIVRLLPDGSPDPSFLVPVEEGAVTALVVQPDGRILVSGTSLRIGDTSSALVRLLPDGSLDPSFTATINPEVTQLQILPDDRIAIAGPFDEVNGASKSAFAVLHPDGSLDQSFRGEISGTIWSVQVIRVTTDGGLLVGGGFTAMNGVEVPPLVRLTPDGELDPTFEVPSSVVVISVSSLALQEDGKVVFWGKVAPNPTPNGFQYERILRLEADGSLDATFGSDQFGVPLETFRPLLLPQPDGTLVVSGGFDSIDGTSRFGLARLTRWGRVEANFTGGAGLQSVRVSSPTGYYTTGASSLVPLPDGRLAAGGTFGVVNESPVGSPVALTAGPFPAAATPPATLAVTSRPQGDLALQWSRAPQQTGYLVERSLDGGSTWTELSRLPSSWLRYVDTTVQSGQTAHYRIRGLGGSQSSASSSPVESGTAVAPFVAWLESHGLDPALSPDLDLDLDGWSLFLEYGLDGHPARFEVQSWLEINPTLEFSINTPRPDLLYLLERSGDGTTWTVHHQQAGGNARALRFTPTPATDGETLLLRLRLQSLP